MSNSYRIRTQVGVDKNLNIQLSQDFDQLQILSLQILSDELYTRSCSDYGVIVGRVYVNGGFGLPNARVSVFIPIQQEDEDNPIITSIYPYKTLNDVNEDGYKYNLLSYEQSYDGHNPTGTFPSRKDVLIDSTAIEVYDKYYKFTVQTNSSGDYMIFGVPTGPQTIVMNVDLSDIGEFSLTGQDLVRMGMATDDQVDGDRFKSSTNLDTLPQIVRVNQDVEVSPLWGENDICQIGINRVDFDLTAETGLRIEPTAVFMGSMFSSTDDLVLKQNCVAKSKMGNLCSLIPGPGSISAIRQTIYNDENGDPILEVASLPQGGKVIDEDGTWLFDLPMNIDYVTTNEFGEQVISRDPKVGIPTKGKYRFKIKWQQSTSNSEDAKRAYYLVPNIREYGWENNTSDPADIPENEPTTYSANTYWLDYQKSYGFDLNWSGYTNKQAAINCEDTFYQFSYNKVYTISGLIDNYKKSPLWRRFIGIKEIAASDCAATTNKFPSNDAIFDPNFRYYLIAFLVNISFYPIFVLLYSVHYFLFIYEKFVQLFNFIYKQFVPLVSFICNKVKGLLQRFGGGENLNCPDPTNPEYFNPRPIGDIKIPLTSYPECQICDCNAESEETQNGLPAQNFNPTSTIMAPLFDSDAYSVVNTSTTNFTTVSTENKPFIQRTISGNDQRGFSQGGTQAFSSNGFSVITKDLPLAERINLFNTREAYFSQGNQIKVSVEPTLPSNVGKFHYDNLVAVVLLPNMFRSFNAGDIVTFVDPTLSTDRNITGGTINKFGTFNVTGTTTYPNSITVNFADDRITNNTVIYNVPNSATTELIYQFPSDVEYYEVITGMTYTTFSGQTLVDSTSSFAGVLNSNMTISYTNSPQGQTITTPTGPQFFAFIDETIRIRDFYKNFGSVSIVFFRRGVDPYSPKFDTEIDLSKIFGFSSFGNVKVKSNYRINIPIQKGNSGLSTLPRHDNITTNSQTDNGQSVFFNSNFFTPSSSQYVPYVTNNLSFYSALDNSNLNFNIIPSLNLGQLSISGRIIPSNTNNVLDLQEVAQNTSTYSATSRFNGGSYNFTTNDKVNVNISTLGIRYYVCTGETYYFSPVYSRSIVTNMNDNTKIIMRSDRLPSSSSFFNYDGTETPDYYDVGRNKFLLQQNYNFQIYSIIGGETTTISNFGENTNTQIDSGVDSTSPFSSVLGSFSCQRMVGLECYVGDGYSLSINPNCDQYVSKGCYVFVRKNKPLVTTLPDDVKHLIEWKSRFIFNTALCQGIVSEIFNNNWVNGTLFAFPIKITTIYGRDNKVKKRKYCNKTVVFQETINNFFYRSSPVIGTTFIGAEPSGIFDVSLNNRNLLYPTTIMDLGPKTFWLKSISYSSKFEGFNISNLKPTSYSSSDDLINLFGISRLVNQNFLQELIYLGGGASKLFSRKGNRVDGDFAQMQSINSEFGVVNYDDEDYTSEGTNPSVIITQTPNGPIFGIFFDSTINDIQNRDYVSPARIIREKNSVFSYDYLSVNSQVVPLYKWNIESSNTIFGDENNDWATSESDIIGLPYQSLDRKSSGYFIGSSVTDEYNYRGYIFSVDGNGNYDEVTRTGPNPILVGAPFHFYFGLSKGKSSLDKFFTKYLSIADDEQQ
jgi:hypothetical protein